MHSLRKIALIAAATALGLADLARAQDTACLDRHELTSLVTFALPVVIDRTITTCRPVLASDGYFAREGANVVARYSANKSAAWPAARAALFKLAGSRSGRLDLIRRLPDSALQPFAEGLVGEAAAPAIKPERCHAIERGVSLVSPLSAESTAELLSFLFILADKPGLTKETGITLCSVQK